MVPRARGIGRVEARAFTIPTDAPEADGTIAWQATGLVVVEIEAGGITGLGYTYADPAAASVVTGTLAEVLAGRDALATEGAWAAMVASVRNMGRPGIASAAVSAADVALWDLKARMLGTALVDLFGAARQEVAIYGSGGFTSYDLDRLTDQLGGWVGTEGCRAVKMKIGADPGADLDRVRAARAAIGEAELFVDANGAYEVKQALAFANEFVGLGVTWFEEPVSSDDLSGLRLLRQRVPAPIRIAAGEYGYDPACFRRMLAAGAVDVLQADATRCGGYTGFLRAAALADAWGIPLSAHTAPALHLPVCCAAPRLINIEWFYDHVRIEEAVFEGAPRPEAGAIRPDRGRPGNGLVFRPHEAERLAG